VLYIYRYFKKLVIALVLVAVSGFGAVALASSVENFYPQHDNYWTGRVMSYTGGYQKHNADLMYGKDPPNDKWQGFAKFDVSTIPDDAVITEASFFYYVVSQQGDPATEVTLVSVDPVTAGAQDLWNAVVGGPVVSPELVSDRGWVERPLNAAGVAALQSALVQDWIALGLHKTVDDNAKGHAKGYQAERFRPYIRINYAAADMGVVEISQPAGELELDTELGPLVQVANHGDVVLPFDLKVEIGDGEQVFYSQTVTVAGVPVGNTAVVTLPNWVADAPGERVVSALIILANDANPANNFAAEWFTVVNTSEPPPPPPPPPGDDPDPDPEPIPGRSWWGWVEGKSVPALPSAKPVRDGGALAVDQSSGLVYATRGNRTRDFFEYDPLNARWRGLAPFPGGKAPGKGAAVSTDGNGGVYLVPGNGTREFWRYDIASNLWERLADVPLGSDRRAIRGGTGLVHTVQYGLDYVYLLKGPIGTFYRYNVAAKEWTELGLAPWNVAGRSGWARGSWLVYDGQNRIYAHRAKRHQLFYYDLELEAWSDQQPAMPYYGYLGRSKKSKDGGSAAFRDGFIYALKGGKTGEYWRYDPATAAWQQQRPMPDYGVTLRRVRPSNGAALVSYPFGRMLVALKGNKTIEFWRFFMPPVGVDGGIAAAAVVRGPQAITSSLRVTPNPVSGERARIAYSVPAAGRATATIFDAAGRMVKRSGLDLGRSGRFDLDLVGLKGGSYFVRLNGDGFSLTDRLVLAR
jgi:hypothetical protein